MEFDSESRLIVDPMMAHGCRSIQHRPMTRIVAVLVLTLGAAIPCGDAFAEFVADSPTPLKLIHPETRATSVFRFSGQVQLSGRYLVTWVGFDTTHRELRIAFFPDANSAALLPRMTRDQPVKELRFSNPEQQAVSILLDSKTARMILAKKLTSAWGYATVEVDRYTISVVCDRVWYTADLLSASRREQRIVSADERGAYGCG
jgi:hypothetical protein